MPPPTTIHHRPKYVHHHPPPPTTSQNMSTFHHQPKYIHHHPPPAKIHPPLSTISQKMDHRPAKTKIYSQITSFRHCCNSFFFFQMQYFFPWRRFCVIKFWSVHFSNSKFPLHSVHFTIFKISCNFIEKETLAQVYSCEFCEISKNTFCYRTSPVAASEHIFFYHYLKKLRKGEKDA